MARELSGKAQAVISPESQRSLQWRLVTWGPVIVVAAAIFAFSSRSSFGESHALLNMMTGLFGDRAWFVRTYGIFAAIDPYSAVIAHFCEYAVLATTVYWAIRRQFPTQLHTTAIAFAITALFAISDEAHQYFVPGRYCDWRDVATDWIGAAASLMILTLLVNNHNAAVSPRKD